MQSLMLFGHTKRDSVIFFFRFIACNDYASEIYIWNLHFDGQMNARNLYWMFSFIGNTQPNNVRAENIIRWITNKRIIMDYKMLVIRLKWVCLFASKTSFLPRNFFIWTTFHWICITKLTTFLNTNMIKWNSMNRLETSIGIVIWCWFGRFNEHTWTFHADFDDAKNAQLNCCDQQNETKKGRRNRVNMNHSVCTNYIVIHFEIWKTRIGRAWETNHFSPEIIIDIFRSAKQALSLMHADD